MPIYGNIHTTRSQRVSSRFSKQGAFAAFWRATGFRFSFIVIHLITVFLLCVIIQAWNPPFSYYPFQVLERDLMSRATFEVENPEQTRQERVRARWHVPHVFQLDSRPLVQLRESMTNVISPLVTAESYDALDEANQRLWNAFHNDVILPGAAAMIPSQSFAIFQEEIKTQSLFDLVKKQGESEEIAQTVFQQRMSLALKSFENSGILAELGFARDDGNQEQIKVYPVFPESKPDLMSVVSVNDVRIADGTKIEQALLSAFGRNYISAFLFHYLRPKMASTVTLREDPTRTQAEIEKAVEAVPLQYSKYLPGQLIIKSGESVHPNDIPVLQKEQEQIIRQRTKTASVSRFAGVFVLLSTVFLLGWGFVYRRERRCPKTWRGTLILAGMMLLTAILATWLQGLPARYGDIELIPILMFAQGVAITFSWELALVLALQLAVAAALGSSSSIVPITILFLTTAAVVVQLGRLHSRNTLIVVGFFGALVSALVTFAVLLIDGGNTTPYLLSNCLFNGIWTISSGFLMSGLLPFIEHPFGILTDMSLFELGDASHPLLLELSRRAPATHSHSMQVGNIAEAACDAIGARGLMARVGARFHDIGKIFKPQYFSENQGGGENIHDTLEPQMSTLVIVSHVKDGVDLAEQHRLPRPIIDFIQQHHGTTLVTFFYGRATRQSKEGPYGQTISESTFRYPGPKPQTKEAAVLMIADAVESACRSLGDAPPGRIENIVRQITKGKLEDGQFDECHMTMGEIRKVENSIINTMVAIRHSRIKYPGQGE